MNTQETLYRMDSEQSEHCDEVEVDDSEPQVQRKPKKLTKRRLAISASQPVTKRNRSESEGGLSSAATEEDSQLKLIIKMLSKIQRDQTALKGSVNKELQTIKANIQQVKDEVVEIKAKVNSVAPPINLENELNQLSQRVNLVSEKLGEGTSVVKGSPGIRLDSVIENVDSLLNKRKMRFYDHTAYTERHTIYSSWEAMEPPFTMAKYLPAIIENEPPEEYQSRKRRSDNDRKCDMELLVLRAERAKADCEKLDGEVAQRISDWNGEPAVKRQLTDEWIKLTTAEEQKSHRIWDKTAKNLRDTPQRQQETSKILERDGRSYAAVAKKAIAKDSEGPTNRGARQQQNQDPAANNSSKKWNVANGKNKQSHKENKPPTNSNTASKATASVGPFHRKGPKFKPKQWEGGYQNQWNGSYQVPWGYTNQYAHW